MACWVPDHFLFYIQELEKVDILRISVSSAMEFFLWWVKVSYNSWPKIIVIKIIYLVNRHVMLY